MLLFLSVVLILGAVAFTFLVRPADLPEPEPVLPWQHLEDRKARIYENLRDLQFEFRVGKLSEADYQRTKQGLQTELAGTLAEIDALKTATGAAPAAAAMVKKKAAPAKKAEAEHVCPHCGAKFAQAMKFCGACGKAMVAAE
jgi:Zn finger protein HypA/HybF involved in hydrogenase expression